MNGRLYDPILRRFIAPDNHIQDPYNTQNFNRYGYVYNNPLMYSDPSGELFWFAIAAGAFIGGMSSAIQGGNFGDILLGAVVGGIAGGVGAGVGAGVGGFWLWSLKWIWCRSRYRRDEWFCRWFCWCCG
ncbi:RHS repeat domain-containing protein [Psychroflexus torquis]|uniref:RHS repeat domain-containing protein n=1 Tax=Psychroflexus torquis TaxID=57029 RepID=UPI0000D53E21|nr:RHS repeat-associated core domain-containing protein [Psychroflexus torquis]